LLVVHI